MTINASPLACVLSILVINGCGGADAAAVPPGDNTAYTSDPGKTVVVGGGGSALPNSAQSSAECVTLGSGECVQAKSCSAIERRDVVVDSTGKVVAVVCYPASAKPTVVDVAGGVDIGKTDNRGVVGLDGVGDGADIQGNVTAAANNVTLYGHGADVSLIGGNVNATGNNFAMRGVAVQGNVEVGGNNATLVLSSIQGNVHIVGNNNVIANCDVLGDIVIEGVNNTLVGNHVSGTIQLGDAKNQVCDGNQTWADANLDKSFQVSEAGAALVCSTLATK